MKKKKLQLNPEIKFRVIVPTEQDRINLIKRITIPWEMNSIIVDDDMFHHMEQKSCPHTKTFFLDGIKYCRECYKALEITSFRD